MSTIIIYGGQTNSENDPDAITISNCLTRSCTFTPVPSDDGTDYRHTKIVIEVSGVISPPLAPSLRLDAGPPEVYESATATAVKMQHMLLLPRRCFTYTVGGDDLVSWDAAGDLTTGDMENGPKPLYVRVRPVGENFFHVDFGIELNQVTCEEGGNPLWTSHRYTQEVTIDARAFSTKVTHGKIFARVDLRVNPDALRNLIIPPVDLKFRREEIKAILQSDGLALEYYFRDVEKWLLPPRPAWDAEGEYRETSPDGVKRFGEVQITLKGDYNADKGELISTALAAATFHLSSTVLANGGKFLGMSVVSVPLWDNAVTVIVKAMLKPTKSTFAGIPFDLDRFTKIPYGNIGDGTDIPPDPGTRGSAGLELIAAALRDPCLGTATISTPVDETGDNPDSPESDIPPVEIVMTAVIADDENALYDPPEDDVGIYEGYEIRHNVRTKLNKLVIPVGKADSLPVVFQTACPVQMHTFEWKCTKVGTPPELPDPDLGDSNFELLETEYDDHQTEVYTDGVSMKYVIAGTYVYVARDLKKAVLATTMPPWVAESANPNALLAYSVFVKGIINLGVGGGGTTIRADGTINTGSTVSLENR